MTMAAGRGVGWLRAAQLLALFALALVLRWHYVESAEPVVGLSSDEQVNVAYGTNLATSGVFSAAPQGQTAVPDAFRSPGMPWLVAASVRLAGDDWHVLLTRTLAVFGALTAVLFVPIARRWLPWPWAVGVGVAAAAWPHAIVFCDLVLVEVPLGLAFAAAFLLAGRASERDGWVAAACAGLAVAAALLLDVVALALMPVLLVYATRLRKGPVVAFLVAALALPLAWSLRATSAPADGPTQGRAITNWVQGSWPNYQDDWFYAHGLEAVAERERVAAIDAEVARAIADPWSVLPAMRGRFAAQPARMASWYLLEKPWLLWDWGIRIGQGDLQVVSLKRSPFVDERAYRAMASLLLVANPWILALALAALPLAWLRRKQPGGRDLLACACVFVAATVAHTVLQAEPRYSTPYRGYELALAATALWVIARWASAARERSLVAHRARKAARA